MDIAASPNSTQVHVIPDNYPKKKEKTKKKKKAVHQA